VHARGFNNRAHTTTGDNARPGRSRLEHDLGRPITCGNIVRNRPAKERNRDHTALASLYGLANGAGNVTGLAHADANAPRTISNHDQHAKAKPPTTFDHFGHAVDAHHSLLELFAFAVLVVPVSIAHISLLAIPAPNGR